MRSEARAPTREPNSGGSVISSPAPARLRGVVSLLGLAAMAVWRLRFSQPALFERCARPNLQPAYWGAVVGYGVLAVLALLLGDSRTRMPQGMPGRLRTGVLGYAFTGLGAGAAALAALSLGRPAASHGHAAGARRCAADVPARAAGRLGGSSAA